MGLLVGFDVWLLFLKTALFKRRPLEETNFISWEEQCI